MTFGGMAAWQAWLLIAGAGAAAAALFLMKLRPPRVAVPSLLLWRRVLDDRREQTLWERIRRAVSLALTILIAGILALAVAQPSRATRAGAAGPGRLLVVLDSSWSMRTRTDSGETRWDRATAQARRLAAAAPGDVALATTADGLVEGPTADRALIEAALDRLAPQGGDGGSWPRLAGATDVHFITDGTIPRPAEPNLAVHSVFEAAPNVAVTAFEVRPALDGERAGEGYLEVANYATAAQPVRIVLTRGSATVLDRRVDMAAGEALRQVLPLVHGPEAALRVRVEARHNALDVDDEASAWIAGARPLSIALVGEDTSWLRSLFEGDRSVRLTTLTPETYPGDTDRADAVIFDRWLPRGGSPRPSLLFAPPDARAAGGEEARPRWETPASHPVVRGVDPFTLTITRARAYAFPDLSPVATSARGTPLVYAGESPDRRTVLVTFGPDESNLTAAPAFPVLVGNALEWLTTPVADAPRRTGAASFGGALSTLTDPDGQRVPLARVGGAALAVLRTPGLYVAEGGGARRTFAVNAGDPQVSNVARTSLTPAAQASTVTAGGARQPWWVYAAVAAFVLAVVEWWTWQRRITV